MRTVKRIFNDTYFYFVIIIAITLVVIKLPDLSLPYYWDEAFPYSYGVHYMYEHGLGFLPSSVNPDYTSGHPLLMFFSEALWMKIFGTGLVAAKAFPLILSVLLLFSIYFFCKKFFSRLIGLVSVILFASQEIFIAQSSFILPEVLISLLTILTFYFYFSNRNILLLISSFCLCFTKETGAILIIILLIWEIIKLIILKFKGKKSESVFTLIVLFIPLFAITAYYIIQKHTYGWYFYPKNFSYFSFNWKTFHYSFKVYFISLFMEFGRNFMTLFLILSIVFYLFRSYRPEKFQVKVISGLAIFLIIYLLFSSINFVSNRYILCLFPIYIIFCVYFIITAFSPYKVIALLIFITILFIKIYFTYTQRNDLDSNLGYRDSIRTHMKVIEYCEKNHLQDKNIYTYWLMTIDMSSTNPGFIQNKNYIFTKFINVSDIKEGDYYIMSSTGYTNEYDELKKHFNMTLLSRYQINKAWSEIYKINL